jgi:hypothetical protein
MVFTKKITPKEATSIETAITLTSEYLATLAKLRVNALYIIAR